MNATSKITQITYEDFAKHISAIEELSKIESGINSLLFKYNTTREKEASVQFPTLESNAVELLKVITNDMGGWIDYWIYDLDFGNKDMGYPEINNRRFYLKTIRDLWDLLNDNPNYIDDK